MEQDKSRGSAAGPAGRSGRPKFHRAGLYVTVWFFLFLPRERERERKKEDGEIERNRGAERGNNRDRGGEKKG